MDDTIREQIAWLALRYHKGPEGEGEYGCPGLSCPGVQRLIAFAQSVALAAVRSVYVSHRQRCLLHGCYYGLITEKACIYCGEPKRTFPLIGQSPIHALSNSRQTTSPIETPEDATSGELCTCLSISRDPLCVHHGAADKVSGDLRARVAFYEQHTDKQANELVTVRKLYEQALEQRDSALTELTDTRRFWQAAKAECQRLAQLLDDVPPGT